MNLSPQKLSVLLDIKKKDARLKIIYALEKLKGNTNPSNANAADYDKDPIIDMDAMSKHMGIDLSIYVNDIRDNYFKRSQSRGWILNYPETKMVMNKDRKYPKSISIPSWLKCFLTRETQLEIIKAWEEKYAKYVNNPDINLKFK